MHKNGHNGMSLQRSALSEIGRAAPLLTSMGRDDEMAPFSAPVPARGRWPRKVHAGATLLSIATAYGIFLRVMLGSHCVWHGYKLDCHPGEGRVPMPARKFRNFMIALAAVGSVLLVLLALHCWRGDITLSRRKGDTSRIQAAGLERWKWSRLLGWLWAVFVLLILVTLPGAMAVLGKAKPQNIGILFAGVFTTLSVAMGVREIVKHWLNYHEPLIQRHVIRVLAIVPIYALDAFATLFFCAVGPTHDFVHCSHSNATTSGSAAADSHDKDGKIDGCSDSTVLLILTILRELYEAYTLLSFFTFLVCSLEQLAAQRVRANQHNKLPLQEDGATGSSSLNRSDVLSGSIVVLSNEQEQHDRDDFSSMLGLSPPSKRPALRGDIDGAGEDRKEASSTTLDLLRSSFAERNAANAAIGLTEATALFELLQEQGPQKHSWTFCLCWLSPWPMGEIWLHKCRIGVLQYVAMQLGVSIVIGICRYTGVYREAEGITGSGVYPYTTALMSLSQMWALYCLVHFYHATHDLLAHISPLLKFISIKMIVFFTFWQSVAVNTLNHFEPRWLDPLDLECTVGITRENFSTGLQACLITAEMFLASLLHRWVFSYEDFRKDDGNEPPLSCLKALVHTFNNQDTSLQVEAMVVGVTKDVLGVTKDALHEGRQAVKLVGNEVRSGVGGVGRTALNLCETIVRAF